MPSRPSVAAAAVLGIALAAPAAQAQAPAKKPNILVIFGDDVGQTNISAYSMGVVGYRTPNRTSMARKSTRPGTISTTSTTTGCWSRSATTTSRSCSASSESRRLRSVVQPIYVPARAQGL